MKKFEKPNEAASGYYLPTSFAEKVIDAINDAEEIEASDEFVFGFVTALSFVCNPTDAETHRIPPAEYIENAFGHYLVHECTEEVITKIEDALKGAGFDVCISEIVPGGDR